MYSLNNSLDEFYTNTTLSIIMHQIFVKNHISHYVCSDGYLHIFKI